MIKKRDVIRMLLPFPNLSSTLARKPHMYVCLESEHPKRFITCQSIKPYLMEPDMPPYQFIEVMPDIRHSPFIKPTLLNCDTNFSVDNEIVINRVLLTTKRRDISEELFGKLEENINHNKFREIVIDAKVVTQLNEKIKLVK